ncbi:MAG: hypothetical protein GY866_03520 [Proteobacteria bacterium]|nr:hypothetical protein [Pseudomonadota bacterium]
MKNELPFSQHDIDILRGLAEKKAEIAQSAVNLERKKLWYAFDEGTGGRPMILAEAGGTWNEVFPNGYLKCEDGWAKGIEAGLTIEIYQYEELKDDHVVEPYHNVGWLAQASDYGVQPVEHSTDSHHKLTSKTWDPPIVDLDGDFHKLKPRTYAVDRDNTFMMKEILERLFDGILKVRLRGLFGGLPWTMGMTENAMKLHGLENMMMSTLTDPEGLHRLMRFLCDEHIAHAEWMEKEGLLTLNNENDYMGSGSMGYTRDLPRNGRSDQDPVRMQDIWVLVESQETVGIGPRQFEEIFFPYQLEIAERFGKCYYGCCEPVDNRYHILKRIPNLERISVSPWADEEFMADALGSDIVYSRKVNPAYISPPGLNEDLLRNEIRKTLETAKGCRVELVMKDVHTLNNERERLARWVEIAREEIERSTGSA